MWKALGVADQELVELLERKSRPRRRRGGVLLRQRGHEGPSGMKYGLAMDTCVRAEDTMCTKAQVGFARGTRAPTG